MTMRWLRSQRALLSDLDDARAGARQVERELEELGVENTRLRRDLEAARAALAAATRERDAGGLPSASAGAVDGMVGLTWPRTTRAELLLERARADQLAAIVDRLQTANMALECAS